ncbi:UDP-glycosyltransferase 73C6 [Hordeum vulgare]|nr:UDP-glycosyltransferase 73C6 [Hordeum vulgare]
MIDAPKGRVCNYTLDEDILRSQYCTKLVSKRRKEKKSKVKKGRAFVLPHCYEVLKDDEKWKKHDEGVVPKNGNATIDAVVLDDDDDDEASSDGTKRSPTPNSFAYSKPKIPSRQAKEKKKGGEDDIKNAMEAIVKARKEADEERTVARRQESTTKERRLAAVERRVVTEERKVALEEKKLARLLEYEKAPLLHGHI